MNRRRFITSCVGAVGAVVLAPLAKLGIASSSADKLPMTIELSKIRGLLQKNEFMLIGTSDGDLWRSKDGGLTWKDVTNWTVRASRESDLVWS